jgi:hemolysin activation/secretion protein
MSLILNFTKPIIHSRRVSNSRFCSIAGFIQLLLLCASSGVVMALPGLPDAGSIYQQQQQQPKNLSKQLPQTEKEIIVPIVEAQPGTTFVLKKINFSGETNLVADAVLQGWVAEAIGKPQDFKSLQSLVDQVTQHLKKQGWILARAYLPKQDITAGIIEIAIITSHIDSQGEPYSIQTKDGKASRINKNYLKGIAKQAAIPGEVLREDELNRAILLMNDLNGIAAHARMEPGQAPGSTKVVVDVDEGSLFNGSAWLDNYGSRFTGEVQSNLLFNLNDLSGYGDQLSLKGTYADGLKIGNLRYNTPLSNNGLKLDISYTVLQYEIILPPNKSLGLKGDSQVANATVIYPFLRSPTANIYTSLGYTNKRLRDSSDFGVLRNKFNQMGTLGINGDVLDTWVGGGLSNYSLSFTSGVIDLSDVKKAESDDAGAGGYRTQGGFGKVNYSFSRIQKLPDNFTFYSAFSGQHAANNLDSAEKMYLGGPSGVRAYSVSEAGGDNAQLLNVELRYDVPYTTVLGVLQLQSFYDLGHVESYVNTYGNPVVNATHNNSYMISGSGLGLSLVKSGIYALRTTWAHSIGDNPGRTSLDGTNADGLSSDSRFWLQGMGWF